VTFLLPPETGGGPPPVEGWSRMLGRGHLRPAPEIVARWVPVPPLWRPGVSIVLVLRFSSEGI